MQFMEQICHDNIQGENQNRDEKRSSQIIDGKDFKVGGSQGEFLGEKYILLDQRVFKLHYEVKEVTKVFNKREEIRRSLELS